MHVISWSGKDLDSNSQDISRARRNFLRGNLTHRSDVIRPPWAVKEPLFRERCTQCDDCVDACPEQVLFRAGDGYPRARFHQAGCTFCARCLDICRNGALEGVRSDTDQAWQHSMRIGRQCLAVQGIVCRTCGDHCETRAIRFSLMTAGRSLPEIDPATCTGCGQCMPVCPVDAITIHDNPEVA